MDGEFRCGRELLSLERKLFPAAGIMVGICLS